MTFILDTNVCIAFLHQKDAGIMARIGTSSPATIALCSVVKAELLYGARHSGRVEQNLARLTAFFAPFRSFPFDDEAAARYGMLRAELRRQGQLTGANDMMIASIALTHDLTLVTRDEAEFSAIPGLRLASW